MPTIEKNAMPNTMNRRDFLFGSGGAAVALLASPARGAAVARVKKAAIIGHTGRGNFGHGLDLIFGNRRDVQVIAVADPDEAGRAKAQRAARAVRAYADYREMMEHERPELVSVAPRWTLEHHAMVSAALAAGAHVYCEKPFMHTLAEADDVIMQAARSARRIAVAHQGRVAPATLLLKRRVDEGMIGDLLEIRVHGKQDRRAGGEDMLVLGTHQFDIVRFVVGDPLWCTARIRHQGREAVRADARPATEGIGLVLGDEIEAMFAFPRGVNVHYTSRAGRAASAGPWGLEFIGTHGRLRMLSDPSPRVFVARETAIGSSGQVREWLPLSDATTESADGRDLSITAANRRVVDDWLAAIAGFREPVCSGHAAMKSLEMIHAVFVAGLTGGRVAFPLRDRGHPLSV
ncbi:MAG: Gfo/Idh/MocA family oxidoreductase [Opitutaceae bacterium]|nr:Gfo/Idh/MocA family oxidoreductase [Opitutaceae bacterium]